MPTSLAKGIPRVNNLQGAYNRSGAAPHITVSAAVGPLTIQDNATPVAPIVRIRNNSSQNIHAVSASTVEVGDSTVNGRVMVWTGVNNTSAQARPSISILTGTITYATTAVPGVITLDGTLINTELGGSQTFGGVINAVGNYTQRSAGFGFNNGLIFNHAMTYRNESTFAANFGSFFTLVDQPLIESDGEVLTGVIHNSVRAQPRFSATGGGSLAWTNCTLYESAGTVTAGVTVTNWNILRAGNRATMAGTITTARGVFINVFDQAVTNYGIECDMVGASPDRFIRMTGTSLSELASDFHWNNNVAVVFGTIGGNRVEVFRSAAGVLRMVGAGGANNEGLEIDFDDPAANNLVISSPTGAGFTFASGTVVIGSNTVVDPTAANWQQLHNPGTRTITVGGDFARRLFSATGVLTVDAAMSNLFTDIVNEPFASLGTGSVTVAGNQLIQTNVSVGDNRYGVLNLCNPSGGSGENRAHRVQNGSTLLNHLEEEGGRTYNVRRDTATFTVARGINGDRVVFADSDGGGFTVNLPASPVDGDVFTVINTGSSANNITVGRNGNTINGAAANRTLADGVAETYCFETTEGWWVI